MLRAKHKALDTDISLNTDPDTKTDLEALKRALATARTASPNPYVLNSRIDPEDPS